MSFEPMPYTLRIRFVCINAVRIAYARNETESYYACRFDFGEENPNVSTRTDGKASRSRPAIVQKRGIVKLEAERDHPRLVQGSQAFNRSWGGNNDVQPILGLKNDVPDVPAGTNVLEWIDAIDLSGPATDEIKEMRTRRGYFSKGN